MAGMFTAQMSVRRGRWRLYVVLMNTTERWPEYEFGPTVPTFTDRVNALSVLGFEPLPDTAWEWTEDTETPDDPSSPVLLIAATKVRSWTGASA
ncbi:DUF6303 family protein [Streptomyces brasiliscabiei]|uniref:DUF6303 family protein n=1 Tax=Streptomyces brasiliscabiei TaxID=2736302 RepID=UPI001C11629A|nr:DUF6303 family protein [Streptomyces brasiliscabiei]